MKKNNKGFTLAELLIVVAIIAVLTVVAVPIFTTQLEKSRENTDIANMREAKAAAAAAYLGRDSITNVDWETGTNAILYFDADGGKVVGSATGITGYGKGTKANGGADSMFGYSNDKSVEKGIIKITIELDGDNVGSTGMVWVKADGTTQMNP